VNEVDDATLLQYAFITNPDILQTSTPTTLTLTVSNGGSRVVTCSSIAVTFRVGPNAKDLTTGPTSIATEPNAGWSVAQDGGIFTLTPNSPDDGKIGRDGLAFVFANINPNDQPGVTPMRIDETAAWPSQPSADRTTTLPLDKFPAGFSLSDLQATPPGVGYDGSTVLNWQGSPATYTLSYDPDGSGLQTWPVNDIGPYAATNLTNAAGVDFTLLATVREPGSDEPLTVQQQCHVDVSNPAPTISTFTATFNGKFTTAVSVTLAWTTTGRDVQCSLTGFPTQLNPNGQITVTPGSAPGATYTLTATNENGSTSRTLAFTWGVPQTPAPIALADTPQHLALSADGTRAYVACTASLAVVDLTSGAVVKTMAWPAGPVLVNVSAEGRHLFLLDVTPQLTVLDATTLARLGNVVLGSSPIFGPGSIGLAPRCAASSPDGALLYLPLLPQSTENGRIACVTTAIPPVLLTTFDDPDPMCTAVSPDGKTLLAGNGQALCAYATETGELRAQLLAEYFYVSNIVFTSDGTTAYALSAPGSVSSQVLTPIDVATLAPGVDVPTPTTSGNLGNYGLALAPDESYVLCGGYGGIYVAEGSPLAVTQTLANLAGQWTNDVKITADGTLAVVAFGSNALVLVPLPTITYFPENMS
jgi:hypothetical protein